MPATGQRNDGNGLKDVELVTLFSLSGRIISCGEGLKRCINVKWVIIFLHWLT